MEHTPDVDNHILLNLIAKGNKNAFSSLFVRYYPKVKRFIQNLLQDEMCAEDLSQDIFLYLWTHRSDLREIRNLDSYLYKASRNSIYQYLRKEVLHKKIDENIIRTNGLENDLLGPSSEELLYADELEQLILVAVDKMPPQRKKIFRMSRNEGKSNQEISELLGISKRTVENHLTLALAELRKIALNLTIFV